MKEYRFYGAEKADIVDSRGLTPRDYYDRLSKIWCADTCAPRMRAEWSEENKTLGQCSITAFLMQDIYGGKVYGVPLGDGNYHCFNVVNGIVFDLTSEQFGDRVLDYSHCPEQYRASHFAKIEKKRRYQYLRDSLLVDLGEKKEIRKPSKLWRKFDQFRAYASNHYLYFFAGLAASLFMSFFHLYQYIASGNEYLFAGVFFYGASFLVLLIGFFLRGKSQKFVGLYFLFGAAVTYVSIPVMLYYVFRYKEYKPYMFDWFVYLYALYGTIKMVAAIVGFRRAILGNDMFLFDRKVMSFVSAFFTLFMMAFTLISFKGNGSIDESMQMMLVALNVVVMAVALFGLAYMGFRVYRKVRFAKKK